METKAIINKRIVRKKALLASVSKDDLVDAKTHIIKWFIGVFLVVALLVIGLYFKK
jgi:hypothetical protein